MFHRVGETVQEIRSGEIGEHRAGAYEYVLPIDVERAPPRFNTTVREVPRLNHDGERDVDLSPLAKSFGRSINQTTGEEDSHVV